MTSERGRSTLRPMERSVGVPIWADRPVWADDALLAAGLAAFGVVGTLGAADNQPTSRPPGLLGWGLLVVAAAAVAFRRRHPLAVLAVTAAATAGWLAATPTGRSSTLRGRLYGRLVGPEGAVPGTGRRSGRAARAAGGHRGGRWPGAALRRGAQPAPPGPAGLGDTAGGCRCGSGGRPGSGASRPPPSAAAGPTRSGCGWPGSCTTWSRTRSP
jgi:hypothetical protein